ncbi:MAG: periplasmic heavy metal sensor [Deltaproteobacteria bacterium]|nr:periplasmic heavy metal sensor [Deltaproteobacteria bacterium]
MKKTIFVSLRTVTVFFLAYILMGVPTGEAMKKHHESGVTEKASASTPSSDSGMMGGHHGMDRGRSGYGRGMGPDRQGWQNMTPEQREQWRDMRGKFMQDTLPLRQELSAKQMELETLWDQKNPDSDKVKALSDRITELRAKLDQKHDALLTQCRRELGDRGWTCPGGGWRDY